MKPIGFPPRKVFERTPILTLVCIALISLAGAWVIHYTTRWGPAVWGDSTGYIFSARNFLDGHGIGVFAASGRFRPLGYFPPFYPLVLSVFGFLGIDLVSVARWLNIALFGMTILLIGISFYAISRSSWLAIGISLLMLTSPEMITNFTYAMSEPLFYLAGYAGLFLLVFYLREGNRPYLISAAIATGLAFLTRYSGVSLILTCMAGLAIFQRRSLKQRLLDIGTFCLISTIPMVIWRGWLIVQPHAVSTHRIHANPGNIWRLLTPFRLESVYGVWHWLFSESPTSVCTYPCQRNWLLLAGVILGALLFLSMRKLITLNRKEWRTYWSVQLSGLLLLFGLIYNAILMFSFLYATPTPGLGGRLLSPLLIAAILLIGSFSSLLKHAWPSQKWIMGLPLTVMVLITATWLPRSYRIASDYHQHGEGFTSVAWRNSEVIQALRELPSNVPIITNTPSAVLFLTNRPAFSIDELKRTEPLNTYTPYGDNPDNPIQRIFRDEKAALALFNSIYWQLHRIYYEETPKRLDAFIEGLHLYRLCGDGAIYFYPGSE